MNQRLDKQPALNLSFSPSAAGREDDVEIPKIPKRDDSLSRAKIFIEVTAIVSLLLVLVTSMMTGLHNLFR